MDAAHGIIIGSTNGCCTKTHRLRQLIPKPDVKKLFLVSAVYLRQRLIPIRNADEFDLFVDKSRRNASYSILSKQLKPFRRVHLNVLVIKSALLLQVFPEAPYDRTYRTAFMR